MGFWGDMLKIMAHTGLQTGGNLLVGGLTKDWAQQGELKNYIAKQMFEAAPTASDVDQPKIQQAIKELSGFEIPMSERLKTIAGTSPSGPETSVLAQGKSSTGAPLSWVPKTTDLGEVPSGVVPELVSRLITPVPKLETQVASEVQRSGASPFGSLQHLKRTEVRPTKEQFLFGLLQQPGGEDLVRKITGKDIAAQELGFKYNPAGTGTEQIKAGASAKTAEAATTKAGAAVTTAGAKVAEVGIHQKAQESLANYHAALINQGIQKLSAEKQKAIAPMVTALSIANTVGAKTNKPAIDAAVKGLNDLGIPVIHPTAVNQFLDAFKQDPKAAIRGAQKLGHFDAYRAMGLIPNE